MNDITFSGNDTITCERFIYDYITIRIKNRLRANQECKMHLHLIYWYELNAIIGGMHAYQVFAVTVVNAASLIWQAPMFV